MPPARSKVLTVAVLGAAAVAVPSSALAAPPAPASLDILLANDDGFAAPGIQAVRKALTDAGHRVTVVAPATDQSGVGTAMNLRFGSQLKARQESPGVWSVAGTPSDAVFFGLQVVFKDKAPDLVVSGSNFGHNTGAVAGHSGTVGAALSGSEHDIPSIAVSTEFDIAAGQNATIAAFPATAKYVADLVGKLQKVARGKRLLPVGLALNVNYPITTAGPKGTKLTRLGATSFVLPKYQAAGPDTYVVTPEFPAKPETVRGADTTALAQDYVSVTPLDGDWTAVPALISLASTLR